ncbi:zinc-binding metallopeptidase family protein [Euzebyella saccharophila]|uniref:Zinc-binding metallopeptidase n=1 Tax=Euzebyella saccharophila TaxID=679664 RepID=A0ABV8JP83_9FLAO|nr:putative zinc-binding metallopeptidase [Euzebyella saccharophila]
MKIFNCKECGSPLYFENTMCIACGSGLGYLEKTTQLVPLTRTGNQYSFLGEDGKNYRYCENHQYEVCNWLVEESTETTFCTACALNRTIPDLSSQSNLEEWRKLETAKHRLVYSLIRLGLQVEPKSDENPNGLAFEFLSETATKGGVTTGHLNGVITINLAEADAVHREYMRKQMAEPYRTLIGHFRHEVGHYYWNVLIADNEERLKAFRDLFGDERTDYSQALDTHYKQGASQDWIQQYISTYASSHPWEDWAETWAHYLHIIDMLETAFYFGIQTGNQVLGASPLKMEATFDPYQEPDFERINEAFTPLTFALNSLNRSMGQPDIYPFVIPVAVLEKMKFIHQMLY